MLGHVVEVTDKVNARRRVEQNEERLCLAQTAAQIGTWEWDPTNGSSSLSAALHEIFGTDPGDSEYVEKWASRVYAGDWERVQREMEQGHRAGNMEFEYRYVHPRKGVRWFYCKGRRLYEESRMFGVVLDVTDRKSAELRLAAQQKVSHALATSADLAQAAPQILRAVCDVLDWKVGGLWIVDPGTQVMRCIEVYTASPLQFARESCKQALKRGEGLPGRVWERAAPAWIQDVVSDSNFPRAASAAEEKLHSAFGFPIMQRELVLGVLEFLSDEIREPDPDLLNMMSAIGAQVGQYLERVQAQEALRESEERYRTVAETASDAIIAIDDKSTILFANSATQEVFGYTPEELIGQPLTALMPANMRHRHNAGLQRYLSTGEKHLNWDAAELPGVHKSGRDIPLEVSFGQYSKAGKQYFTGFARDITQRKNAEQALRRSEEQFRALANSVPQLVWMANADGWIFWYNQRWYEYTGTTAEQMQGWGWQSVHDPATLPDVLQRWRESLATSTPFEMVFPLKGADGRFRSFLTRVNPIRNDGGQIIRWFGTNTDISAQQEILQALRVSQESLRAALMASDTGTFRWNPKTDEFLHFDDNLKRLFGIPREERVSKTEDFIRRVHPEDRPMLEPAVEACRNGADFEMEYRVILPDGSIRWLYDRAKMEFENGRPMYLVGACTDITARKLSEQALLQTEKLAAAGRLAATVAHEINNPLEAVTNYIFLALRSKDLPPTVKRHLQIADQELSRVTHIAQQTLGFYRATTGPVSVDAKELVQDVLRIYERKFSYKNLTIETEVEPGLTVYGAPGELKQVLSNLVANALDASVEGGKIRVRAKSWKRAGHRGAAITVADSGTGMSREVVEKAFTAFFTTKKDIGTGLGLWASKNIVEKHHGSIRIRSWQGKHSGTIVRIVLPPQQDVNQ